MFPNHIFTNLIGILISICLVLPVLTIFVYASGDIEYEVETVYDLWSLYEPNESLGELYEYFLMRGLISNNLSYDEFDYICVLAEQISTMTDRVKPSLAIAVIAVESGFDNQAKNGSARGLMQLIPIYHSGRMKSFVEEDHLIDLDDFHNPRLNVATGIDYLDEILEHTGGDIQYALMWYNQGPASASKDYVEKRHVSSYARKVIDLSEIVESYL